MLKGKQVLLVSHRPTGLAHELAGSLASRGAHVTLALRHPQDATFALKRISKRLSRTDAFGGLSGSSIPLNISRLSSIQEFAASVTNNPQPLDLLVLDTWDLYAAGHKDRRWYTQEGVAGTAQTGFIGPAVLLHLLRPKVAASGTCVLLTASPAHRLAALDDLQDTLTSWGHSTPAATQAALLSYTRRLALQLHAQGVRAAAVDLGVLSEQPLKGSLLRKLPVLHQALNLLLPPAHDAATLLADVASHLLAKSDNSSTSSSPASSELPGAPHPVGDTAETAESDPANAANSTATDQGPLWDAVTPCVTPDLQTTSTAEGSILDSTTEASKATTPPMAAAAATAAAPAGPLQQAGSNSTQPAAAGASTEPSASQSAAYDLGQSLSSIAHSTSAAAAVVDSGAKGLAQVSSTNIASKPFSYISQGLLANPLITALDHTGTSTWLSRALHTLASPVYDLASTSLVTTAVLADWPVRALLLRPMGAVPAVLSRLGPLGAWATWVGSQLQGFVPGVVGVPADSPPAWVEVQPSGAVLDDKLGWRLWYLADTYASMQGA